MEAVDLRDVLTFVGLALVAVGAGLWFIPLGVAVLGVGLIYIGLYWVEGDDGDSR